MDENKYQSNTKLSDEVENRFQSGDWTQQWRAQGGADKMKEKYCSIWKVNKRFSDPSIIRISKQRILKRSIPSASDRCQISSVLYGFATRCDWLARGAGTRSAGVQVPALSYLFFSHAFHGLVFHWKVRLKNNSPKHSGANHTARARFRSVCLSTSANHSKQPTNHS